MRRLAILDAMREHVEVTFGEIEEEFLRLKNFLTADLKLILEPGTGGNYISAALIACACDALTWLISGKKNKGEEFFTRHLLTPQWAPVGKTIYDAVRNGLVHSYETKDIVVGGTRIRLGISRKEKPHLTFDAAEGILYLNVQQLTRDLLTAIDEYQDRLKDDENLRAAFRKNMKSGKEVLIRDQKAVELWQSLLRGCGTS